MNTNDRYMRMLEARYEADKQTKKVVEDKIAHLVKVGRTVLRKKMTPMWASESLDFLGELRHLLKDPVNASIVWISEKEIIMQNPKLATSIPRGGEFKIPREMLSMSTWDFAKKLRQSIYQRKAYLKRLEVSNAERKIKEIKDEIARNEREIKRLENLRQANQDSVEKRQVKLEAERQKKLALSA